MSDNDVLGVLARIEDEHHIRQMHQASMTVWLHAHPCACEAHCDCGDHE